MAHSSSSSLNSEHEKTSGADKKEGGHVVPTPAGALRAEQQRQSKDGSGKYQKFDDIDTSLQLFP